MSAPFTVATDMPSEEENHQHHQKRETSKKPESTAPGFFNYVIAKFLLWFFELFESSAPGLLYYNPSECCLWWFELFLNVIAFHAAFCTSLSISLPFTRCHYIISEWPYLGSFLIFAWVLWIPTIGFVWCAFRTRNWKFLWPYIIYYFIFYNIYLIFYTIDLLSFFYPSIKESMSNPKVKGIADDFQKITILWPCIMLCCYWWLEAVKLYREIYFLRKTEP